MKRILRKISHLLPDRLYISLKFKKHINKWPNLAHPETFNEKIQWMKLHDRDPLLTQMVDKYAVKAIVSEKIGDKYVIPAYGVWDRFEDIEFDKLPDRFVLKTTHDCGGVVICKDKSQLDLSTAKTVLEAHQKRNYYYEAREWPYKNAKPRILAEEFAGEPGSTLVVYKVFCFHGVPKIIQVIQDDKSKNESIDYFDTDWNLMDLRQNYPNSKTHLPRPPVLTEMLEQSAILAGDRPFIRVDWYVVDGQLKFSEFTFYSDAGLAKFSPAWWDKELGSWIDLQDKKEM